MGKIAKQQNKSSSNKKLNKRIKDEIRLRFIVAGDSLKDLAEEYGVAYSYLRWLSSMESWALLTQENEDNDLKRMYNEALVSKSYQMLDIYDKIIQRACMLLKKTTSSKDLMNIVNVIKTAEQRQFVLLLVREDKENG